MFVVLHLLIICSWSRAQQPDMMMDGPRVYAVNVRVSDFQSADDFSKPERAYASIHRRLVNGDDDWRAMSVSRLTPVLPKASSKPIPLGEKAARGYMDARIAEVRMISDSIAYVIAQWPTSGSFDVRCLELEEGRWLSADDKQANTIEAARKIADDAADTRKSNAAFRKSKQEPKDYLVPFVQFLQKSNKTPKDFALKTIAERRLVAVGQIPHRPDYWKLLADVISDPNFAEHASTIFLQLPQDSQSLIDQFLDGTNADPAQVIELLRNAEEAGSPDQAMLDFFLVLWKTNQSLPADHRLRVVLVDATRPWKLILLPQDLRAYDVNHDEFMAHAVLRDLLTHQNDARHSLLIANFDNVARNLRWRTDDSPIKTAGWHLSQVLGDQYFAFLEHLPQISSHGTVSGRAGRGLFDSAFTANDNKPVAFALAHSPFGAEVFDGSADLDCTGTYRDAFDGYLYVERLEDEYFSPLIEDFYTEAFVKEIDRRHQITHSRGLADELGLEEVDAISYRKSLYLTWGQPRTWKEHLGPIDAWRIPSDQTAP